MNRRATNWDHCSHRLRPQRSCTTIGRASRCSSRVSRRNTAGSSMLRLSAGHSRRRVRCPKIFCAPASIGKPALEVPLPPRTARPARALFAHRLGDAEASLPLFESETSALESPEGVYRASREQFGSVLQDVLEVRLRTCEPSDARANGTTLLPPREKTASLRPETTENASLLE